MALERRQEWENSRWEGQNYFRTLVTGLLIEGDRLIGCCSVEIQLYYYYYYYYHYYYYYYKKNIKFEKLLKRNPR